MKRTQIILVHWLDENAVEFDNWFIHLKDNEHLIIMSNIARHPESLQHFETVPGQYELYNILMTHAECIAMLKVLKRSRKHTTPIIKKILPVFYKPLSKLQRAILTMRDKGFTNQEIASAVFISLIAVKKQMSRMFVTYRANNMHTLLMRVKQLELFWGMIIGSP